MLFYKVITSYTFLLLSYLERSVILWYIIKYDEKNNVKFFKLAKFKKQYFLQKGFKITMKQKFLKDLGIDIDDTTEETLNQFDLNGFLDQISDNRLKEEDENVEKAKKKIEEENKTEKEDVENKESK